MHPGHDGGNPTGTAVTQGIIFLLVRYVGNVVAGTQEVPFQETTRIVFVGHAISHSLLSTSKLCRYRKNYYQHFLSAGMIHQKKKKSVSVSRTITWMVLAALIMQCNDYTHTHTHARAQVSQASYDSEDVNQTFVGKRILPRASEPVAIRNQDHTTTTTSH